VPITWLFRTKSKKQTAYQSFCIEGDCTVDAWRVASIETHQHPSMGKSSNSYHVYNNQGAPRCWGNTALAGHNSTRKYWW
jgi:hypothetical protein